MLIKTTDTLIFNRNSDAKTATGQWLSDLISPNAWFKDVVPNFRILSKEDLPKGFDSGTAFTSVCIDTAVYLAYLKGQCLKQGVVFKRAVVKHISDAAKHHHLGQEVDVIVNCSGLGARKLGGVMDLDVIPVRGQIVLVRNDPGAMCGTSGTDDGDDELCYMMKRAGGSSFLSLDPYINTQLFLRRGNSPWGNLYERKLGLATGRQSSSKNHEARSRDMPSTY